jgi:hypothetical protein
MPVPVVPVIRANVDFQVEFVPADGISCHFQEAETSVRRRFLGSEFASRRQLPRCRVLSTGMAGFT